VLADLVSLVRFAMHEQSDLHPFRDDVHRNFAQWMRQQESNGRKLPPSSGSGLEAIRDHVAASLTIESEDSSTNFCAARVAVDGGEPQRVSFAGDNPWFLAIARRGNRMAFTRLHRDTNIYRVALQPNGAIHEAAQALISSSSGMTVRFTLRWFHIAFVSNRTGPLEIWVSTADGKDPVQLTAAPDWAEVGDPQWSPDGSKIAYDARPRPIQR